VRKPNVYLYHLKFKKLLEMPLSLDEKKGLAENIRNLPPQFLKGLWEII
jgi:hypothetical protein